MSISNRFYVHVRTHVQSENACMQHANISLFQTSPEAHIFARNHYDLEKTVRLLHRLGSIRFYGTAQLLNLQRVFTD